MDVTRVFDLQVTFGDNGLPSDGETFSGTLTIDVTAGSVGRPPLIQHFKNFPFDPLNNAIFIVVKSSPGLFDPGTWQIIATDLATGSEFLNLTLDTTTTLVGYRGGQVDGHVEIPGSIVEIQFTGSLTPSLSSPAGDLFLIADHDTTRTVIAPLQTSQVIAVVGSNVAFDGAADFNNDGLSDLLAHTDAGGCEPYLLIK